MKSKRFNKCKQFSNNRPRIWQIPLNLSAYMHSVDFFWLLLDKISIYNVLYTSIEHRWHMQIVYTEPFAWHMMHPSKLPIVHRFLGVAPKATCHTSLLSTHCTPFPRGCPQGHMSYIPPKCLIYSFSGLLAVIRQKIMNIQRWANKLITI